MYTGKCMVGLTSKFLPHQHKAPGLTSKFLHRSRSEGAQPLLQRGRSRCPLSPPMPDLEGPLCRICGSARARNGRQPNKYCDRHIDEGIAAGHISSKRARCASPAGALSSLHVSSLPPGWKLLELKHVYGCRYANTPFALSFPTPRPPACLRLLSPTRSPVYARQVL